MTALAPVLDAPAPAAEPLLLSTLDEDGIARLTLNRPAARNALSRAAMSALQDALAALAEDPRCKVVVLAANGPVFCAGHDLREIRAENRREIHAALFAQCSELMQQIVRHPRPVIAEVQGTATAAGCQLVASCDLAIAADSAHFATPGVNIGLFCSTPMVALSRNVGPKAAMHMLLTGEAVDADEAIRIGLINRAVPAAALSDTVMALARTIAGKSPLVLKIGKEAFYRQRELDLADAYEYCAEVMTDNLAARDAAEGIDAFLQKRQPSWRGE